MTIKARQYSDGPFFYLSVRLDWLGRGGLNHGALAWLYILHSCILIFGCSSTCAKKKQGRKNGESYKPKPFYHKSSNNYYIFLTKTLRYAIRCACQKNFNNEQIYIKMPAPSRAKKETL